MKKCMLMLLLTLVLFSLTGCSCDHDWQEADCRHPKTCLKCGETEGMELEHDWIEATCTTRKHCSRCAYTRGEPLGHTFREATCTESAVCTVCGFVGEGPLGHSEGDWEVLSEDWLRAVREERTLCRTCGVEVQRRTRIVESLHDGQRMLLTPLEFGTRLETVLDSYQGNLLRVVPGKSAGKFSCDILSGEEKCGFIRFRKGSELIAEGENASICFDGILCSVSGSSNIVRVMTAVIQTCDPQMTFEEAKAVASTMLETGGRTIHGIHYSYNIMGSDALLSATVVGSAEDSE